MYRLRLQRQTSSYVHTLGAILGLSYTHIILAGLPFVENAYELRQTQRDALQRYRSINSFAVVPLRY